MAMTHEEELLAQYVLERSELAFREVAWPRQDWPPSSCN